MTTTTPTDTFVSTQVDPEGDQQKQLRAWSQLSRKTEASLDELARQRQALPAGYQETGLIATGDDPEVYASLGRLSAMLEEDARLGNQRPTGNVVADALITDAGKASNLDGKTTLAYGEVTYRDAQGKLVRQPLEADDFHHQGARAVVDDQTMRVEGAEIRRKEGLLTAVTLDGTTYSLLDLQNKPFDQLPQPLQKWLTQVRERDNSRLLSELKLLTHGGAGKVDAQGRVRGESVNLGDPAQVHAYRQRLQTYQKEHAGELKTYPDPRLSQELSQLDRSLAKTERSAMASSLKEFESDFASRLGEAMQKAPPGSDMRELSELLVAQSWANDPKADYHDQVDPAKVKEKLNQLLSDPKMEKQLEALRQQSLKKAFPDLKGAARAQADYLDSPEFAEAQAKLPADQREAALVREMTTLNSLDPNLAKEAAAGVATRQMAERLAALSPAQRQEALAELGKVSPELAQQLAESGQDSSLGDAPVGSGLALAGKFKDARNWEFIGKLSDKGKQMLGLSSQAGSGLAGAVLGRFLAVKGLVDTVNLGQESMREFSHDDVGGGIGKALVAEGTFLGATATLSAALGLATIPGVGWIALGAVGVGLAVDAIFGKSSEEELLERAGVDRD